MAIGTILEGPIMNLNTEVEKLVLDHGALRVGFITRESVKGGPPSANIIYNFPDAQSAIIFAVPLNRDKIRAFLRKDIPNGRAEHNKDNYDTYVKIYRISGAIKAYLEERGFKSVTISPNFKYRDVNPRDWAGIFLAKPEISLRYLAVRAGVGSFGWSGNIGIKGFGTAILLGGVTTTAPLTATDPIPSEESFCTKCMRCVQVCAFRMFDTEEEERVMLGGFEFHYSKRRNILRCITVCLGYNGLDKTQNWSTWSPARYSYPETDEAVVNTLVQAFRLKPRLKFEGETSSFDFNRALGEDDTFAKELAENPIARYNFQNTRLSCGNCQLVCRGDSAETLVNYELLVSSGFIIRTKEGTSMKLPPNAKNQAATLNVNQSKGIKDKIIGQTIKKQLLKMKTDEPKS